MSFSGREILHMTDIGKAMIVTGVLLAVFGILIVIISKVSGLVKLPGDVFIQKGNFTLYFPLVTCLVLSIILSFIFNFWSRQ